MIKIVAIFLLGLISNTFLFAGTIPIKAVGIPLADHYAAIIAYEKYKDEMKFADYSMVILPGPNFVRRYFRTKHDVDIAFNVAPMVMDMYSKKPDFKWVSLIHRDGNALAINDILNAKVNLNKDRLKRLPDSVVADALKQFKIQNNKPVEIGVSSLLATHTTILYKYLKDNNQTMGLNDPKADVSLTLVKPPKSIAYLKGQSVRQVPSGFEQSLPWVDVIETQRFGKVAWYSKDVMKHNNGHVECIIIAKDSAIATKKEALKEVIYYIHKAGQDIESARLKGGKELDEIIKMVQKHIPKHTKSAIEQSLRADIMAINYSNLNVDEDSKNSFKKIMDLAYEAGFIKKLIDIESLSNEDFSTKITVKD